MFEITCDKCGAILNVDTNDTMNEYFKDSQYSIDEESGRLFENSLQKYLVYKCEYCNSSYKFTYKDWEVRHRMFIAEMVMGIRKQEMFKSHIDPRLINADNGVSFCGQCSGYGGDGYCLNDIIKQCTIRKKDV